ncbi:DUF4932 domain-containing protein [Pedobacter sp. KACC 23697]|uniref:DUF4932 domain-containing protein n=1 Tax=Pedobacter sp. KACC 23697 TaxID=3149230 RepID=A0AAU7K1W7_9SPHI
MLKKVLTLLSGLLLFTACTVSKQWNSKQTQQSWEATFQDFSGNEKLKFPAHKDHILYLNAKLATTSGSLQLFANEKRLSHPNPVSHHKLDLKNKLLIKLAGNHAKGSFRLNYPQFTKKNIEVRYNSNIELLALSYVLANYDDFTGFSDDQSFEINGQPVKVKALYALTTKIANTFKSFLKSENLKVIKTYFDKDFYAHYANFVMSLPDFPNATVEKDNRFLKSFSSLSDAQRFTAAFNSFFLEINFQKFLVDFKPYYETVQKEITTNMPASNFIAELENLFGKEVEHYVLYPSLTMPFSSGFAVGSQNTIGNIFASTNQPKEVDDINQLKLGFDNSLSLRTIAVHEFGHAFVNPAIDLVDEKIISASAPLFEPIKKQMSEQGYNQWKICLYEHFNRANEVMIARLLGDRLKADEILKDNVDKRFYRYLPQIVDQLECWYNNEFLDKSYAQKAAEIITALKAK